MKRMFLLLFSILLFSNFSQACIGPNLANVCAKSFEETIICDGQPVTNHKIVLTYITSCTGIGDQHFWIELGVSGLTSPYPLQFLYSFAGGGSWIGYYAVTISEYNNSGGVCTSNPDWPGISQTFFDEDGHLSCSQPYIYTYYNYNSITQPTSFPNSCRGFVCCEPTVDIGLTDEATACIGSNEDGQQFIKVTVPDYWASQYDITVGNCSVPPSANQGTMYLYAEINGSWNMMGLVANCRYQQNGGTSGSPWDYYFNVSGLDLSQCYQYFVSYLPDIIGHTIPDFAKTACKCDCDASFKYQISTWRPNVVTFFANGSSYGNEMWHYGNGTQSAYPQSVPYQIGSYAACHDVNNSDGFCESCINICINDTTAHNPDSQRYHGILCDADFTIEVDTRAPYAVSLLPHNVNSNASYHINWGDGTSSNGFGVSKLYSNSGSYTICLTVTDGVSSCTQCLTICVGKGGHLPLKLSNEKVDKVHFSPNPVTKTLNVNVSATTEGKGALKVTDMIGRVILIENRNFKEGTNLVEINTSDYVPGIYIVEVILNGKTYREQIVKK